MRSMTNVNLRFATNESHMQSNYGAISFSNLISEKQNHHTAMSLEEDNISDDIHEIKCKDGILHVNSNKDLRLTQSIFQN